MREASIGLALVTMTLITACLAAVYLGDWIARLSITP